MSQGRFLHTTILAVTRNQQVALGGDGQVSFNQTVLKSKAAKVRLLANNQVIAGFAGAAADSFTLFELFEKKAEQHSNNLSRAAVELAKEWRTDRILRRLEAMLVVANSSEIYLISGTGDVIAPDDGAIAIGSGGNYALAAARALIEYTELSAREIVEKALHIAAEICVYTNGHITVESLSN